MKQKLSIDGVAVLLRDMEDAEGVAFLCDMFDVRGETWNCRACALAELTKELSGKRRVRVTRYEVRIGSSVRAIPTNASAFTRSFDRGEWPELEA